MKETIMGYDQSRCVAAGLDLVDLLLLHYVGCRERETEYVKSFAGTPYVWVRYNDILGSYPILGIKKRALANRLERLVEKRWLDKITLREGGNFTYFRVRHSNDQGTSVELPRYVSRVTNKSNKEKKEKYFNFY